ncbi:MAG: amidohydrolase family protein [Myxococcota bacterium]|nr:amidohydrolase family protein [Myxococcota bacterium]
MSLGAGGVRAGLVLLAAAASSALPALAAPELEIAIRADTLYTSGPQGTLADGVVIVREGKIRAVGPAAEIEIPKSARVYRAKVVTPGLIDAQSTVGLSGMFNVPADQDQDEKSGPLQAGLRVIDGFNPAERLLGWLLAHGITTVQVSPGEANPIAGQAGVFKTWAPPGTGVSEFVVRFPSALVFNLGEVPKATYAAEKRAPTTRMGTAALIRKALSEAGAYARKRSAASRKGSRASSERAETPERSLPNDALALVLARELPALFVARREDDLATALRLGEEFGLEVQLADATEGYLMAGRIARAGVPVLVGPVMERVGSLETMNASFENAAILAAAGVPVVFRSGFEGYVPKVRVVLFEAAIAAANGFGFDAALTALTSRAARVLGVEDRIGSLEPGKDADLVLYDGDPFEYSSHVERVLVGGELAYSR